MAYQIMCAEVEGCWLAVFSFSLPSHDNCIPIPMYSFLLHPCPYCCFVYLSENSVDYYLFVKL